jgi:dihydroorotate dehydrogenase electron transfer subunit
MKRYAAATVVSNERIAENVFDMRLSADFSGAAPGRFAGIYIPGPEFSLPRPLSFCGAGDSGARFVYRAVGKGTEKLSRLKTGDEVNFIAPLGSGYAMPKAGARVAVVGGGLGIPPLLWLTASAVKAGAGVTAFLGFRSEPFLVRDFAETGADVRVATDDGSFGARGSAVDLLELFAEKNALNAVYACGPKPMLRKAAAFAEKTGVFCQLSLEERMACGVGACYGCAVPDKAGAYRKCCSDGPVFNADEVSLDD